MQMQKSVAAAIADSALKLNPRVEGQEILVPVPECASLHLLTIPVHRRGCKTSALAPCRLLGYNLLSPGTFSSRSV